MSARRDFILREMGLTPLWRPRARETVAAPPRAEARRSPGLESPSPAAPAPPAPERSAASSPAAVLPDTRAARIAQLDWDALEAEIAACAACRLCEKRQNAVPGMGDRNADVMFVGEGPGGEEDRRGLPFVGAAGKLLDAMLAAIGLTREHGVYIANTVKCRPPHNRTPQADEMAACRPYLDRQIALVRPRLLVALGRPAAQVLLGQPEVRINAARGSVHEHAGIALIVTYHPAYLLRNQADKARAWEDLCHIRRLLDGTA
nr:uracil-DNA glycosylase [Pseudazoarcus pumilus]